MACETMLKPRQTKAQRKAEVKKAAESIDKLIAARKVQVKVGPQGAVTFVGIPNTVRDGMTDACIYNALLRTGSIATRAQLQKVNPRVMAAGVHSHDGGVTWSTH